MRGEKKTMTKKKPARKSLIKRTGEKPNAGELKKNTEQKEQFLQEKR